MDTKQLDAAQIGQVVAQVLDTLQKDRQHEKAPATLFTATPLHGVTNAGAGIFSTAGLDPNVISTVVRPIGGISASLSHFPNVDTDPRYGALTGVSDDIGEEPTNPCDPAPSGFIKACNLTAQFGRVKRQTETIEIDQVMLRINRGDFKDLRLIGELAGRTPFMPENLSPQEVLDVVTVSELYNLGVRLERKLAVHTWEGTPANNTAGGGYKEFPGLSNQIATGQKDADTGDLCPSLDSEVKDFDYDLIGGGGRDIVEYLSMLEYFITTLAEDTGMLPAQFAVCMRPQLWQVLSSVWPILYNTDPVNVLLQNLDANIAINIDGSAQIKDRDAMRNSKTIVINGNTYPVITDIGINEQTNITTAQLNPGEFASTIFFVPIRVAGNFPATQFEYVDYRRAAADIRMLRGKENFWSTNEGRFLNGYVDTEATCYELFTKIETRVVLRTPQLAGRIDNCKYSPLQHVREADPDSPYFVDGGVSFRAEPAKNAVWLS